MHKMEFDVLIDSITTVGFPIAMCLAFMLYIKYLTDLHKAEIDRLSESVNNNTLVMQQLLDKLGDDK